jgi:hypothetical protein
MIGSGRWDSHYFGSMSPDRHRDARSEDLLLHTLAVLPGLGACFVDLGYGIFMGVIENGRCARNHAHDL